MRRKPRRGVAVEPHFPPIPPQKMQKLPQKMGYEPQRAPCRGSASATSSSWGRDGSFCGRAPRSHRCSHWAGGWRAAGTAGQTAAAPRLCRTWGEAGGEKGGRGGKGCFVILFLIGGGSKRLFLGGEIAPNPKRVLMRPLCPTSPSGVEDKGPKSHW